MAGHADISSSSSFVRFMCMPLSVVLSSLEYIVPLMVLYSVSSSSRYFSPNSGFKQVILFLLSLPCLAGIWIVCYVFLTSGGFPEKPVGVLAGFWREA